MKNEISPEEYSSIKRSYFNILALFLSKEKIKSKYVGCLLKWSAQLNLSQSDLQMIEEDFDKIPFELPKDKLERLEAIYHLVHMIYLDNIVEDIELEVASVYAENLGFKPYIVADLFKSIATAPFDGKSSSKVRDEVKEFLNLYEND